MLKSVAFRNVLLFNKHQVLNFHQDGAYFLIGATGAGKNSILELVRRCNDSDKTLSSLKLYDTKRPGCVVCRFILGEERKHAANAKILNDIELRNGSLYSMLFVIPEIDILKKYRIVLSTNENGTKGNAYISKIDATSIYWEGTENDCLVCKLLQFTSDLIDTYKWEKNEYEIVSSLKNLSPDPSSSQQQSTGSHGELLQLSPFNKCCTVHKYLSNYLIFMVGSSPRQHQNEDVKAVTRSEQVLVDLLVSKYVDHDQEKKIFAALIFPQEYEFEVFENKVSVINKNSQLSRTSIDSISEGIINAKLLCLLLCNSVYKTIFLQSLDMGMHPSMIGKFRDMILKRVTNKIVVASSHHPHIISSWTLPRTFICQFQRSKILRVPRCENKVVNCLDIPFNAIHCDEMKKIPFSAYVLLLEGRRDKLIIRYLLQTVQQIFQTDATECKKYALLCDVKSPALLCDFISVIEIISQSGSTNHYKNAKLCASLGIPCMYVYDKDVFISKDHKLKTKSLMSFLPQEDVNTLLNLAKNETNTEPVLKWKRTNSSEASEGGLPAVSMNNECKMNKLLEILEKSGIFMWTVGKLNEIIMSEVALSRKAYEMGNSGQVKNMSDYSLDFIENCVLTMINGNCSELKRFLKFVEIMAVRYFSC